MRFVPLTGNGARLSFNYLINVEIRFSIIVRKLLKRASFTSKEDLKTRLLEFINYFNLTMAKPFKRTCRGKVLAV